MEKDNTHKLHKCGMLFLQKKNYRSTCYSIIESHVPHQKHEVGILVVEVGALCALPHKEIYNNGGHLKEGVAWFSLLLAITFQCMITAFGKEC